MENESFIPNMDDIREQQVNMYLYELGFACDNIGTILYKRVILNIIGMLEKSNNEEEILQVVQNPYSMLYENIASFHGINALTLHRMIYLACPNKDIKKHYIRYAYSEAKEIFNESLKEKFDDSNVIVLKRKNSEYV